MSEYWIEKIREYAAVERVSDVWLHRIVNTLECDRKTKTGCFAGRRLKTRVARHLDARKRDKE